MHEHNFLWDHERFTLVYSIEHTPHGFELTLEDVSARSVEVVNAAPDWVIELEASTVAAEHGATYL